MRLLSAWILGTGEEHRLGWSWSVGTLRWWALQHGRIDRRINIIFPMRWPADSVGAVGRPRSVP